MSLTLSTMMLARTEATFGEAVASTSAASIATSAVVELTAFLLGHNTLFHRGQHFEAAAGGAAVGSILGVLGYIVLRRSRFGPALVCCLCVAVATAALLTSVSGRM